MTLFACSGLPKKINEIYMLIYMIYIGPDHVQVFWNHKSIGNQAIG